MQRRAKSAALLPGPSHEHVAAFGLALSAEKPRRAAHRQGYRIAARRWKTLLGEIDRGGGAGSL
jgi:hypothetical protein